MNKQRIEPKFKKDGEPKQSGGSRSGAGPKRKDPMQKLVQIPVACPLWMRDEFKERMKIIVPREIEALNKKYNKE